MQWGSSETSSVLQNISKGMSSLQKGWVNLFYSQVSREKLSLHAAAAKSLQSCLTPCDPIDISPPGSPVPGILQATTLEWVAISFEGEVAQSCRTLRNPMDCSLPGFSAHGIFQARVLEWVAIAFSSSLVNINHLAITRAREKGGYIQSYLMP